LASANAEPAQWSQEQGDFFFRYVVAVYASQSAAAILLH
jgi:hypothetical protein